MCGGSSPMGYFFYLDSLFSPHGDHFFRVCVFSAWGRGALLGLPPPHNNFCGSSLLLSHFYCPDIYNLSRSWRFQYFMRQLFDPLKKLAPTAPPPPAPTKINNLCPPPMVNISAFHITIRIL